MRLVGTLAALLLVTGCAPMDAEASLGAEASARRCFTPNDARLIKLDPASGAYVRTRSGEALELTGHSACFQAPGDPSISLRAVGPENADVCIGDPAHLYIRGHAVTERACSVRIARVVPQSEIARLEGRQSP